MWRGTYCKHVSYKVVLEIRYLIQHKKADNTGVKIEIGEKILFKGSIFKEKMFDWKLRHSKHLGPIERLNFSWAEMERFYNSFHRCYGELTFLVGKLLFRCISLFGIINSFERYFAKKFKSKQALDFLLLILSGPCYVK